MSDTADVESALVALAAAALYPLGTAQPSVADAPCRVFRGWPTPAKLDADLAAGNVQVSVFAGGTERRQTRYLTQESELPHAAPTFTLAVAETEDEVTITATGTPSPANAAAKVNGIAYALPVTADMSLSDIALGLADLIAADTGATPTGPVIALPPGTRASVRVGGFGGVVRELRRQKKGFTISCWCPNPATRDTVAEAIDLAIARAARLTLPDGTAGHLWYERTWSSDAGEKEGLYRRDLMVSVEYGTTETEAAAEVVVFAAEPLPPVPGEEYPPAPIQTVTVI